MVINKLKGVFSFPPTVFCSPGMGGGGGDAYSHFNFRLWFCQSITVEGQWSKIIENISKNVIKSKLNKNFSEGRKGLMKQSIQGLNKFEKQGVGRGIQNCGERVKCLI